MCISIFSSASHSLRSVSDEHGVYIRGILTAMMLDRLAPYERRVIELLRNSKDKRARKMAKKRVCRDVTL